MADVAIPYEEPAITTILVQSSFLLLSNIINAVLDHVFYCGLVGQVLLGMAWGTPGAKLLSPSFQEVATQLGYLGLIAIVFEGGLATSAKAVQKTLLLSICVAVTGIVLPIALSFSLLAIAGATNLQAFAAGSALCSTSLGTTFSLLKTTGLTTSRLGTVLTSAAMLDDVVGLVMVQVIANLGSGHGPVQASTVLRPIFVSVGFAIVIPLVCKFLVGPLLRYQISGNAATVEWLRKVVSGPWFYVVLSTATLVALVCAARYAGTSALFAAYLAGAVITWVDDSTQTGVQPAVAAQRKSPRELNRMVKPATDHMANTGRQLEQNGQIQAMSATAVNEDGQLQIRPVSPPRLPTPPPESNTGVKQSASSARAPKPPGSEGRGMHMYRQYYAQAVERILKPLFFASVGFSIPITQMFRASVVWRGFVYAILMAVGKLCCGIWLIRFTTSAPKPSPTTPADSRPKKRRPKIPRKSLPRPKSLYPASILGCAMVARGEIGFLISAIAASNGIFAIKHPGVGAEDANGNANKTGEDVPTSDIYLVVTWAILLCTILGPLALGCLAKRVKRLQAARAQDSHAGGEDPLGVWGVA